jgi:hypothetical protein
MAMPIALSRGVDYFRFVPPAVFLRGDLRQATTPEFRTSAKNTNLGFCEDFHVEAHDRLALLFQQ